VVVIAEQVLEVCGARLIAIDCEMVDVTEAKQATRKALARLSAVDASGAVLIDELVQPPVPVSDYLTQWSGISARMLEGVTTTLADAQQMLLRCMGGSDCILVGHGLENDLHALRMVHDRVVDTAVCYPRSNVEDGRKQSLRTLASKLLKQKIQQDGQDAAGRDDAGNKGIGHDSVEDASTAMRLALMRLRFGYDDVKIANYSREKAQSLAQQNAAKRPSGAAGGDAVRNLREGLLSGHVLPSSTPFLSPAELASEAVRQSYAEIDAQANAKASFQKIMPEPGMFNCEKCGSDLVRHTSAQIARADEAETVFLTCFNCDHKWALDRGF
jgi:DNA-directed RNA polymerase subunit M/transcription elongation factor TFIIS